ncbi:MAG TPA: right-handed parallel beta-helix repeat-containing protein [Pirellulales bacterium]|nr:right-handed parallel beta-helix repeat-containing protein [Pirellulales bacterium]
MIPTHRICSLLAALFFVLLPPLQNRSRAADSGAADFYVSPLGRDRWSGRRDRPTADGSDGPLATVSRAQALVRELKTHEPQRQKPIVVAIRGGTYFLDRPLVFEAADSGSERAGIVYRAYAGERPMFSGGVRISDWKISPDGRWQTKLPEVKAGKWSFAQLFVDDRRCFRPRLPKHGYYTIAERLPPASKSGVGDSRFAFRGDDIRADWANQADVEVMPFLIWSAARLRIAAVDPAKHVVSFTGTTRHHENWAALDKGHRFLVDNVREALSEPGQWYLDRPSGELTYIPLPNQRPADTTVIAPRLEQLFELVGTPAAAASEKPGGGQTIGPVEHLQFEGLTFDHSNWTLPPHGQAIPQAEVSLTAAISAVWARDVVFRHCAVEHTGAWAIEFGAGCRQDRVEDCELVDLGAGGVKIGDAQPAAAPNSPRIPGDPQTAPAEITVRNSLIAHGGRLHPAAVGVWIGHSPRNTIDHNEIADFYYTGISVGWTWGYAPSNAHDNAITANHIHTLGQHVLSDMGGVYSLGLSPGTVVSGNVIHDVQSFDYGGWGLYTDEGSSGMVLKNNLVYRTKSGSVHQHYGRENHFENNIFAFAQQAQLMRTRSENHVSFFLERNIVYWDNASPLLGSNWRDNNFHLDNNVYWNPSYPEIKFFGGLSLDQWRAARHQDEHSLIADPRLVDPAHGDFHVRPDSPALRLGFQPFDYTKAGRTGPADLTKDLPPVPPAFEPAQH